MWNTTEMSQLDAALTGIPLTLNFQGQIVSQEWDGPIVMEQKERESIGCPDAKH